MPRIRRKNTNHEQRLQRLICDWITIKGGVAHLYKLPTAIRGKVYRSQYLRPGTADILVNWFGRFVAIEVKRGRQEGRNLQTRAIRLSNSQGPAPAHKDRKRPAGVLSRLQEVYIDLIRRRHGLAFVAYSLDDVRTQLEPLIPRLQPRPLPTGDDDHDLQSEVRYQSGPEEEE